jgi:RHS repeat-associated protein
MKSRSLYYVNYFGNYFENNVTAGQITRYYYAGGVRVAMQRGGEGVKLILGDHLGSTSVVLNADGSSLGTQGYDAWGLPRFTTGTLPTKYTFTGQYSHVAGFGLMFYQARWYSPELGRFGQADSIIPEASMERLLGIDMPG